jgi:DNA repair exonuclease SbcCD ATPase subunit
MASSTSVLGSALVIPQSAFDAIDKAEKRLANLKSAASSTAKDVRSSFADMTTSVKGFGDEIDKVVAKLGKVASGAQNAASSAKSAFGGFIVNVNGAAASVDQLAQTMKGMSGVGTSGVQAAALNFTKLADAVKNASGMNIAQLKNLIDEINKMLSDENQNNTMTRAEQDAWVQQKRILENELKYQLQTIEERKVAHQKAVDNMVAAEERLAKKSQSYYKANAEGYKSQNYKNNTTYSGALQFSDTANTINRQTKAIEYLEAARKNLSRTDADYEKKLQALNEAILKNKEALQSASVATTQKNAKEAYLSNTSQILTDTGSASTLKEHVEAIKTLQQARLRLVTTDTNYKNNLSAVNEAIKRHSKILQDAGINARNLGEQYSYLQGYLSRLAQRAAVAFSAATVKNFVEQVAEVRGQFELSQRSLEAILQDKSKADEIFNKTIELAVKSPFRIKDLTDYVRQLSAYRIESDKLYDTTKRLADVSAGLGVDMGRIILAYGQVKAAAYLRGSEVRQFTEAGINMYGELQSYFKEVKGEAYTTAQIVDMISKKKVTFEDVEAIFQRMTDKGGTFYNMQEIQADTLSGKISNLKDSFDVIFNEIGKDNDGLLKGLITTTTDMLGHWKEIATIAEAFVATLIVAKTQSTFLASNFGKAFMLNASMVGNWKAFLSVLSTGATAAANALKSIGISSLVGLGITAAIQSVSYLVNAILDYRDASQKATEETIKAKGEIGALASEYSKLRSAMNTAIYNKDDDTMQKNIESRRVELQKLIDVAGKDGLTYNIDVQTLNSDNVNQTFEKIRKEYESFVDDIERIRKNYAANNSWNTWFTDGLNDDASDYKSAVVDALSLSNELSQIISVINANYSQADKTTKAYFDTIRAGQKDGESNIDYMSRMYAVIQKLNESMTGGWRNLPEWGNQASDAWSKLRDAMSDVTEQGSELEREFDAVFGNTVKKYKNDPIKIQAIIDKIAAENDWNQYERDLAYKHFGINVTIDKANAEKQVSWVDNYLQNFFAQKKYGINLVVKNIDDDKALDSFIEKGDAAAKAAKKYQELEKRISRMLKQGVKTIDVDDSIRKLFNSGDPRLGGSKIDLSTLQSLIKEYKKASTQTANALGVDPFEKENNKVNNSANKAQRDLLQERISLLKDMNSEYQNLIKRESEEAAAADVRKHFALAAQDVGLNITNFIPDRQTTAKKIEEFASQYKELTKRSSGFRTAAEIRMGIDEDYFKQQVEDAKNNAEEAFSKLDLFKKLKDTGLNSEQITTMFGDLVTNFEDVRKSITDDYQAKWGSDMSKWGDDVSKSYNELIIKLDKKVAEKEISDAKELIKDYKQKLTERLQLDEWYYTEKMKIENNSQIAKDPVLQKQMLENLQKQFEKKTSDMDWKDFQNSDTYVKVFEDLDHSSTKVIDYIIERLDTMKDKLKGLDPTQVKAITSQIDKLNETKNSRNPFKSFTSGLKEMISAAKTYKALGGADALVSKNKENDKQKEQIKQQEDVVAQAKAQYEQSVENASATEVETKALKEKYETEKATLDTMKEENKATQSQVDKINAAETASTKAKKKFSDSVNDITTVVSSMGTAFNSLMSSLGESDSNLTNAVNLVDHLGQAVGSYFSGNYGSLVSNAVGAIGDVINLLNGDNNLTKQIEEMRRSVEKLQRSYETLKTSMDNAFDMSKLEEYQKKSIETLEAEVATYRAMYNAENAKKKTDESALQSYEEQIEDLEKTIKELKETMIEDLGGFGTEANYKSAAQEFADAWVDAFNEGSNTLDALTDKFDDYFENLIKKQAMYRATEKFIKPILQAFDDAVSEGSEGGNNGLEVTKNELAQLQKLKDENLAAYNEYLNNLMDVLGVTPSSESNLSDLQQGIQSVSEATAQALESILNSMRFYLATQQADVRIIRDTLLERVGATITTVTNQTSGSNELVVSLLQQQVDRLKQICDNWSSVMKTGHSQGGKGLKVFMN